MIPVDQIAELTGKPTVNWETRVNPANGEFELVFSCNLDIQDATIQKVKAVW